VSNAGLFQLEPIESLATGEFEDTIRTNLFVPFHLFRAFLAGMRARGSGDIVTIGSIADRTIFPGNGAYAASKHGARALHEVLRTETRGTGVRATLVSPAGVDTALWDNIRLPESDAPPDRTMMMRPEAVADAVLYAVTRPREVNVDELRLSRT
jgi:NADP-dependent 3-hydroxy acid dehydrogenase YdfG